MVLAWEGGCYKLFFLERIFFRCHVCTVVDADVGVLDVLDIYMHTLDEFLMLVEQAVIFLVECGKVFFQNIHTAGEFGIGGCVS